MVRIQVRVITMTRELICGVITIVVDGTHRTKLSFFFLVVENVKPDGNIHPTGK